MAIEILMPALSPTMEEGTLGKWLVAEGDKISSGDILAEIETDKATMEFEAVDEGIIGKLLIAEGTAAVAVNSAIAILLEEGESLSDAVPATASPAPTAAAAALPSTAQAPKQGNIVVVIAPGFARRGRFEVHHLDYTCVHVADREGATGFQGDLVAGITQAVQ